MIEEWYGIKKEITSKMMDFGFRTYVSIADVYGNFKIMDEELEPYKEIIKNSIILNMDYFDVGDYAIPISSKNLMIFKISKKSVVILFANKGNIAQLLSFKKNMDYFATLIDKNLIDVPIKEKPKVKEKKVAIQILGKELPIYSPILKNLDKKAKFSIDETRILQLIDGKRTFLDIARETDYHWDSLYQLFNKMLKKKWFDPLSYPFKVECPDCQLKHYLFIHDSLIPHNDEPLKILMLSEKCNHEFVAFINKKLKVEMQSFQYFTEFQKDKFMKRLGEHYYTIFS
ncbi:MAG: hypothetical protein ACTSRG_17305 [Candidatus Helarchaeota archaeon]